MRKAGVELEEVNYAKVPLEVEAVLAIVAAAGSVAAVLNTRHAIAKEKGWADTPPDAATFANAVVKDVNLLRRPVFLAGKKIIVGFDKAAYSKLK